METLAYLHLALANEAPEDPDYTASISAWEKLKGLNWLTQPHRASNAAVHILSLTVALSLLGMARQASALVKQGDGGSEVTALQQRLLALGYFKTNVTGYYGSVTKAAVTQFQQDKGLTPDGVVGTNTSALLDQQPSQSPQTESESSNSVLQLGSSGEQVREMQKKLATAGYSVSENGTFDQATQEAIKQVQQLKGLTVDGIVGEQTQAALLAMGESKPTPDQKPQKSTSFFDNEPGSLTPFVKKPN